VQESALASLLSRSGLAPRGLTYYNLATYDRPLRGGDARDDEYRQAAIATLRTQDAVVLASAPSDPTVRKIAAAGVYVVDVTDMPSSFETAGAPLADDGGPRPIRAVVTGLAPVVAETQRQLLATLRHGFLLAAGLAAVVVTLGLMSVPAGALAMAASLLPLAATMGALGWLGVRIDLGFLMTAALALGLAIEGTLHVIARFRRQLKLGLSRTDAVIQTYGRCGRAMLDTALIVGGSVAALGLAAFTPVRDVGWLLPVMLTAALAGQLVVMPAVLASPLGWFFAPLEERRRQPLWPALQAYLGKWRRDSSRRRLVSPRPAPSAPHFGPPAVPVRRAMKASSSDDSRELVDGPHAALHAKLQKLRRRAGETPTP
jgi:hypothetical protein